MRPPGPILVVEDQDEVRQVVVALLESAGFDVIAAADGEEGLAIAADTPLAAVVLDNRLPGMSGLEVLAELRSRSGTKTVPVIFMTAHAESADRVLALDAGATDYVVKPFAPDELVARVRAHVQLRTAWVDAVEEGLRRRAAVVEALCRIPVGTAEGTGDAVCAELSKLEDVDAVAVLVFTGERALLPVAAHVRGRGRVGAGPLRARLAERLRVQLAHGPWIDRSGTIPWAVDAAAAQADPARRITIYAPLRARDEPLAVLAVALSHAPGLPTPLESVSLVADFAAIASALLLPALERRVETELTSRRITRLLEGAGVSSVFQPVVDLMSGDAIGYEALTRFADGTPPDVQLAEAERVGLGHRLEAVMLRTALAAAPRLPGGSVFLNLSPAFVLGSDIEAMLGSDSPPAVIEITEHQPVDDYRVLRAAIDRWRPRVQLAVDDAGAGYASLRHVLALEPEFVKLDRDWVSGLDRDRARQALVAGLSSFAADTGCRLIAEGIERDEELAIVRRLGITLGQGYLLGRPAPLPKS